jgi:hypothetical protein
MNLQFVKISPRKTEIGPPAISSRRNSIATLAIAFDTCFRAQCESSKNGRHWWCALRGWGRGRRLIEAVSRSARSFYMMAAGSSLWFFPRDGLSIQSFDSRDLVVDRQGLRQRSARLVVRNTSHRCMPSVTIYIERIELKDESPEEVRRAAKAFRQHPLRGMTDFTNNCDESFCLQSNAHHEILLCFWRSATITDRESLYFSAPWNRFQGGEAKFPAFECVVRVAAKAKGFKAARKCYSISPDETWGFSIQETKN